MSNVYTGGMCVPHHLQARLGCSYLPPLEPPEEDKPDLTVLLEKIDELTRKNTDLIKENFFLRQQIKQRNPGTGSEWQ